MKTRPGLLFAYRQFLRLYPPGFRRRFEEEMIEIAASAQLSEWPLIVSDTGVALIRTWLQPAARAVANGQDEYLAIGETPAKAAKLLQGSVLSTVLVLAACFISTKTVWNLPTYPDDVVCGRTATSSHGTKALNWPAR